MQQSSDGGESDANDASEANNNSVDNINEKGMVSGSPTKRKRKRKHKKAHGGLNKMALAKFDNPDGLAPLSDVAF